jgi:DNA-binding response OmpR family regulator
MGSRTIVLADSSYTIRRIVELSFSEVEGVEVLSFEKGSGLKEKLLETKPAAVIVDVRLPDVNGYDICQYINETAVLKHIPVFLMKGGFEPVDNERIRNLTYRDFITKPFDSNALVQAVSKALEETAAPPPENLPEEEGEAYPSDLPEIEPGREPEEDISFSDIKQEMDSTPLPGPSFPFAPATADREEVQPSEEITQGTQPMPDQLAPAVSEEEFVNPFAEMGGELKVEDHQLEFSPPAQGSPLSELELDSITVASPGTAPIENGFAHFETLANEDTSEMSDAPLLDTPLVPEAEGEQFPDSFLTPDSLTAEPLEPVIENAFAPRPPEINPLDQFPFTQVETSRTVEKPAPLRVETPISSFLDTVEAQEAAEPVVPIVPEPPPVKHIPVEAPPARPAAPELSKEEVLAHLEKKFDSVIQEILWEILPPMAERILKDEIEKIKAELEKGNTP